MQGITKECSLNGIATATNQKTRLMYLVWHASKEQQTSKSMDSLELLVHIALYNFEYFI